MSTTVTGTPRIYFVTLICLMSSRFSTGNPTTETISSTSSSPACSGYEAHCVSQGLLPHNNVQCYEPLTRGPCQASEWFIANDSSEYFHGECVERPCAEGLLPSDARCLNQTEAQEQLCSGGPVHMEPIGIPRCGDFLGWKKTIDSYLFCSVTAAFEVSHYYKYQLIKEVFSGIGSDECVRTKEGNCATKVIPAY